MSSDDDGINVDEIRCTGGSGGWQVIVRDHCKTEPFNTKDEAYADFIKQLIDVVEGIEAAVNSIHLF